MTECLLQLLGRRDRFEFACVLGGRNLIRDGLCETKLATTDLAYARAAPINLPRLPRLPIETLREGITGVRNAPHGFADAAGNHGQTEELRRRWKRNSSSAR